MKLAAMKITIDTDEDLTDKELEILLVKIEEILEPRLDGIEETLKREYPNLKVSIA